jgi:hypothetical protein
MRNSIYNYTKFFLIILPLVVGCDDKLDFLDKNNPTIESYFKNTSELEKGVNAVYSTLRSGELVGREWFYVHDMRGAECNSGGDQLEAPRAELLKEPNPSQANAVMTTLWRGLYRLINRANIVIAEGPKVTDNPQVRDRIVCEAKFLRAWAYFELVSLWGNIPVYTEPIYSSTQYVGLSDSQNVYDLIINDLSAAIDVLPLEYSEADKGRVTKGAAYALVGKALMQRGDYSAARDSLLNIYGKYSLVDNYNWNFDGDVKNDMGLLITQGHEFNEESIFEVAFVDKGDNDFNWGATGEGITSPVSTIRNQEFGITWGNVIPSKYALEQFDDDDPRYKFTFWEEGDVILNQSTEPPLVLTSNQMNIATSERFGVVKKRFFRKYSIYDWVNSGYHPSGINHRLIRYADVLLMLAECEAELNNPTKSALYINEVRSRASVNMPSITTTSKEEAILAVIHERAVEFCGEERNNLDLIRWRIQGYIPTLIQDPKPGQIRFLPIPAEEVAGNPLIN